MCAGGAGEHLADATLADGCEACVQRQRPHRRRTSRMSRTAGRSAGSAPSTAVCRSRRCHLPLCWPRHPAHVGHEAPQRPQQAPRTAMAAVAGGDGLCHAAMSRRPRPGRGKSESATTAQRIVRGRIPSELPVAGGGLSIPAQPLSSDRTSLAGSALATVRSGVIQ
eukprot:COSAG01_NODE_12492_length_1729_cov_4.769325_3_plen_166_part_00